LKDEGEKGGPSEVGLVCKQQKNCREEKAETTSLRRTERTPPSSAEEARSKIVVIREGCWKIASISRNTNNGN